MARDKLVILVTGGVGSGKSRLLQRLQKATRKWWQGCGFMSLAENPRLRREGPADAYSLEVVGRAARMPWATRRADGTGFDFNDETRLALEAMVRPVLDADSAEICFLDEIGRLELGGRGFADLFRLALDSRCRIVVAAVKKALIGDVVEAFGIASPVVIDLDATDADHALKDARRRIAGRDAERIGAYAGIGGLIEVGLGTTLHAYRVPLKGHVLTYLQNLLLVTFGKPLKGRGLVRIAFISAMLKAFSPMGNPFRPMAYIFLQGCMFAAPIRLLGWNLAAVLLGSVLMVSLMQALSLAKGYVIFGKGIFDAFSGVIATVGGWIGVQGLSLFQVIAGMFVLNALFSLAIGAAAYFGDMQPLVRRLSLRRKAPRVIDSLVPGPKTRSSFRATAWAALGDVFRPRFLLLFFVSALLMLFFAKLSQGDFLAVLIRGLCISYVSFLAIRRIDLHKVGLWLDRRLGLNLGKSLPIALGVVGRKQPDAPPDHVSKLEEK